MKGPGRNALPSYDSSSVYVAAPANVAAKAYTRAASRDRGTTSTGRSGWTFRPVTGSSNAEARTDRDSLGIDEDERFAARHHATQRRIDLGVQQPADVVLEEQIGRA